MHWLLSRQKGLKPLLWVAAAMGCCHAGMFQILGVGRLIGLGMGAIPLIGLAGTMIEGGLFAWVASRFLVEARRTGELELLLTTPLGAQKLFSTQWETLKGLARAPVLLMVGLPLLLQGLVTLSGGYLAGSFWKLYYGLALLVSSINTVLGIGALFWLAPWFALQFVGQGRVIFWTVLLVKGLPFAASFAWSVVYRELIRSVGGPASLWSGSAWLLGFLVPQVATLLIYSWLIRVSSRRLLHRAAFEPLDLPAIIPKSLARMAGSIRRVRSWKAA
jgi:hypothetical protein